MTQRIPIYWWRPKPGGYENLGDYLTVLLVRALGHEPVRVQGEKTCLFACGTLLHPEHYRACRGCLSAPDPRRGQASPTRRTRIVVWGSGCGVFDPTFRPPEGGELMFRAVRGPHTRRAFRLPEDCPLGDPGLLAPHFWPAPLLPPSPAGEVLTVCHIGTQPPRPVPGSDAVVSMRVKPGQALEVLARIARARLVLTESLHGAILAQAYGVPWAPAASQERGPASAKWADWYAYLGLEGPDRVKQGSWQRTVSEGWSWWEEMGQQGRVRDLGPLLGAFPLDAFR